MYFLVETPDTDSFQRFDKAVVRSKKVTAEVSKREVNIVLQTVPPVISPIGGSGPCRSIGRRVSQIEGKDSHKAVIDFRQGFILTAARHHSRQRQCRQADYDAMYNARFHQSKSFFPINQRQRYSAPHAMTESG